jgi:hypothetical protein
MLALQTGSNRDGGFRAPPNLMDSIRKVGSDRLALGQIVRAANQGFGSAFAEILADYAYVEALHAKREISDERASRLLDVIDCRNRALYLKIACEIASAAAVDVHEVLDAILPVG